MLHGMIAAFVGRGIPVFEAACLGAYLHGLAGDKAAKKYGEVSLLATHLLECLPSIFKF